MGITLGEGWLPKRPYPQEDAPPASVEMNDTAALLSAIKDALSQFAANTMAPTQLPPVVTAPQPVDLSPVLEALNRPVGLSADDLRAILASIPPAPTQPDTSAQLEVLTGVAEALKTLDFRMRGTGGGGSLSPDITDRGNRILGHVTVDQMPAVTVVSTPSPSTMDPLNSTSTLLGANATFAGPAVDGSAYNHVMLAVYSDKPSATNGVLIEFSQDGVNWDDSSPWTFTPGAAGPNQGQTFIAHIRQRYYRVSYTNGTQAQTVFRMQSMLDADTAMGDITSINGGINGNNHAQIVSAQIFGLTTGGGGGYVPVKVNPSGTLTADASNSTNVGVTGTVTATQGTAAAHNAGWETRDYFTGGQVLADQTAAGAALTFTFTTPVQLVQVMTTGVEGRADPFGGTPTSTTGIRVLADTPTLIPVQTSSVQVFAASGGVSVTGFRY